MVTPLQRTRTQMAAKAEHARRDALCDMHDAVRQVISAWKTAPPEAVDPLIPALEAAWDAYEAACRASDEAKALERTAWNGAYESTPHRVLRSRCVLDILPGAEG